MTRTVTAQAVKAMLHDGQELALLDVREQAVFGRGHLLFACNLPLSQLELQIADLVPRAATRIVLCDGGCDGGEGLAGRAAVRLAGFGYTDVAALAGGVQAWAAAGYVLFGGLNVPSKAFGEFVEHEYHTPNLSAEELKGRIGRGEPVVVLDSRPLDEYRVMNIPGAIDVPGAELAYRVAALAPSPETLVVVNCAGRTRSIIGAQSLINAGIPNPVRALRNGTMGWHLAGYPLEHGSARRAPELSPEALAIAMARAAQVARRFGVRFADGAQVGRWRQESAARSLYLLDVRSPEEYEAGHLPGTVHAAGGQLVQATDRTVATRNARLVLLDDTGVRAIMTASWLIQMGWQEVYVWRGAFEGAGAADTVLERGPHRPRIPGLEGAGAVEIEPAALAKAIENGQAAVVDLAGSPAYHKGHIGGAWFAIRARLEADLAKLPRPNLLVLTSPDGVLAKLAAPEARAALGVPVRVLRGGTAAWQAAGRLLTAGAERMASAPEDAFLRAYDRDTGVEQAMEEYLSWETGLVEQLKADGDARFKRFPPQ
ncbi:MAG: thiosulfate sulfurtransferase [Candidatus Lambdaproteobacteria bacterium]|nr:thiosulfate sulfurtransferase [Candidatus Lambdaproteobacteria bacterium]